MNVKPLYYGGYRILRPMTPTYYFTPCEEMLEEHSSPPISHDDVLEFHELLYGLRR